MKKTSKSDIVLGITIPLLFILLIVLTVVTFYTISNNNAEGDAPAYEIENTERAANEIDVSGYLLPQFIGLTSEGKRYGISSSYNLVSELYRGLSPTIYSALSESVPVSDDKWDEYALCDNSVYIKYHTELPGGIIGIFAGMTTGREEREIHFGGNVREMFIIPDEGENYETVVAVRDSSGNVTRYTLQGGRQTPNGKQSVTASELAKYVSSYGSGMNSFTFAFDDYDGVSCTEPVYLDTVRLRGIVMTDKTAALVRNSADEVDSLMRAFELNPDKILGSAVGDDESMSYYDTQGILYIRDEGFEYTNAYNDSGIRVSDITGGAGNKLTDYIRHALYLFEQIKSINAFYTGGDADLLLSSAAAVDGEITLEFMYAIDNVHIDCGSVYTVVFHDGLLRSARLKTMTAGIISERVNLESEWWIIGKYTESRKSSDPENGSGTAEPIIDVAPVYYGDFVSDYVGAEWAFEKKNSAKSAELGDS